MKKLLSWVIFPICLFYASYSAATTPIDASLAPMLKTVLPTVVNIKAQIKVTDFNTLRELQKRRSSKGGEDLPVRDTFVSVASGVIVDAKNGYILTNAHVVNDAQSIAVTLGDGRHFIAKMIGIDKPSDIALLQIKAANLTSIALADSNKLKVGDYVAAIGNPFGLNSTATSGIVSALGRTTLGIETFENFIQTDASINPGNSGGALIDMHGELVGINTAILAPDRGSIGIGFAIPANMAKSVMQQLIEYGDVKRGVLGIGTQDITPELANAFNITNINGSTISQVQPKSPAEEAGLRVGDIITAVNGTPVKSASDVINTLGFLRVNTKVNVNIVRDNKPLVVNVTLSDPKKHQQQIEHNNPFLYGVGLKNLSLLSPIHGDVEGVAVISVEPDSLAWQSDLRTGDVITSVNRQKIKTIEELKNLASKTDKLLLLNVLRGPSAVFIVISKDNAV